MANAFGRPTVWVWLGGLVSLASCGGEEATGPNRAPDAGVAAVTSKIAFISGNFDSDIFTINPDGTGLRRLTTGELYTELDWAPNRAKLAARRLSHDIYAVNADGSGAMNLTNTPNARESEPRWSPSGTRIVYTRDSDIYVMNASGSGQTNLTRSAAREGSPRWSPDGSKIVYISDRPGYSAVHVMNANGSGQRNLTNTVSNHEHDPAWSPDGQQIAFTALRGLNGNEEIYVMTSAGNLQKSASSHPGADESHRWSPSSQFIAFSTDRTGNSEIFRMRRWGGEKVNLTKTSTAHEVPRGWSPDGTKILYQSGPAIWVMGADGSQKTRIASGREAVWSR